MIIGLTVNGAPEYVGGRSMKNRLACILCFVGIFPFTAMAGGQGQAPKQKLNSRVEALEQEEAHDHGDQWYKVSCSLSASLGIVVCGELPSGKQTQESQKAADVTAGVAEIQKMQGEAEGVSGSISDALKRLQSQDSQSSGDIGGAEAVILQKVKEAADNLIAATPGALAQARAYAAQPAPDGIVPTYTAQQLLQIGGPGAPAQFAQNASTPTGNSASQDSSGPNPFLSSQDVSGPDPFASSLDSSERNPFLSSQDVSGPEPFASSQASSNSDNGVANVGQTNRYSSAVQIFNQSLQLLGQFAVQHADRTAGISSVLRSGGVQIQGGSKGTYCRQGAQVCR